MDQTEPEEDQMFGLMTMLRCFAAPRCQHKGPDRSCKVLVDADEGGNLFIGS